MKRPVQRKSIKITDFCDEMLRALRRKCKCLGRTLFLRVQGS
jgi:hypothetical protein